MRIKVHLLCFILLAHELDRMGTAPTAEPTTEPTVQREPFEQWLPTPCVDNSLCPKMLTMCMNTVIHIIAKVCPVMCGMCPGTSCSVPLCPTPPFLEPTPYPEPPTLYPEPPTLYPEPTSHGQNVSNFVENNTKSEPTPEPEPSWTVCTVTCGGGTSTEENNGGSRACNTAHCPNAVPIDVKIFPRKSEKEVDVGDRLLLRCKATAPYATHVTWSHDDVEVTETDRNARVHTVNFGPFYSLQLKTIEEDDSGIYKCAGAAPGSEIAEATIELFVWVKLEVTSPTEQFGLMGETGVVECLFKGKPAPTAQWLFSNLTVIQTGTFIPEVKYSMVDDGLQISDLQKVDEMTYICFLITISTGDTYQHLVNFAVAPSCNVNNGGCQMICQDTRTRTGPKCYCPKGYELHQDGVSCHDFDECALKMDACSHHCVNTRGAYECVCPRGKMLDIDNNTCIGDLYIGNLCEEKDPPWTPFFDFFSKLQYCFRRDPTPNTETPFYRRTYSEATADCLSFDSKIVTPRGQNYNRRSPNMFPFDGLDRWIDIKYDRVLKMYVQNGGVPMDTRYLRESPWDAVAGQPTYGREGRDCTVTNFGLWKNVPCTDSYHFVCEYKVCPRGWSYNPFVDRCNKEMGFNETFDMATKRCSKEGAIIETPRSREAELFLNSFYTQSHASKMWIGMMHLEHTWRWNDGAKVTWTAWDRVNDRNLASSPTYKCMTTNGTVGDNATTWHRAECNGLRALSVCGQLRCRYPYRSHVFSNETMPYHTCYRFPYIALNARQAGQFCSEDGSESNPSRLTFPDNHQELLILRHITGTESIWTGYAWNRAHLFWQSNNNTFDTNSNYTFNSGRNSRSYHSKQDSPQINPRFWANAGHLCTYLYKTDLTPSPCEAMKLFVCEREQPYILTSCPEEIQNAERVNGLSNKRLYYPRVPQSQRMNCYYYNTQLLNYAEADRYCAGLGGYIMMPKSTQRLKVVTQSRGTTKRARIWIGADSIGHCFNRNYTCDANSTNNFKYIDGSYLAGIEWGGGQPNNEQGNCVAVSIHGHYVISTSCMENIKTICQVAHNNLRAQRNWDFLTACQPDYEEGVANWYAAPGDKCYHLYYYLLAQKRHIWYCKQLSSRTTVSPAKPMSKEQTRILVLSRTMNMNKLTPTDWGLHGYSDRSYIGVVSLRLNNTYRWNPDKAISKAMNPDHWSHRTPGSYISPEFLNFKPGVTDSNDQRDCVIMVENGRWERVNCAEQHYLSCEKPSVASLTTWRAMHPMPNDFKRFSAASRSDMPRSDILWLSMGITISYLLVVV